MSNEENYNLELKKAIREINRTKPKTVCIQLPDGLKNAAGKIQKAIEEKTKARVLIWAGSCFGACDVPQKLNELGVDILIQWGHSEWQY